MIKDFLFKNISWRQTVAKNTFWLLAAEAVSKLSGIVLVIYLARILGAGEYGKFVFALSFASVISVVSDLGVADIATRELAKDRAQEARFSGFFTLEAVLCLAALAATAAGAFLITADASVRVAIMLLALFVESNSLFAIIFAFLRARQHMQYEALVRSAQAALNLVAVLAVVFVLPNVKGAALGYLASNLLILAVALAAFHVKVRPISWQWGRDSLRVLAVSWPLSLGVMAGWLYISLNSIVLGYLGMDAENGWYGAASKIAMATVIAATLVVKSFYPLLSRLFVESKEKLQRAFDYFLQYLIFLALPLAAGGWLAAPRVIHFLYGSSFAPAGGALQWFMASIALSFVAYPYALMLVVANRQRQVFFLIISGAVLTLMLDLVLIPVYGWYGAVIAIVAACLVQLAASAALAVRARLIRAFDARLVRSTLAALIATVAMYLVMSWSPLAQIQVVAWCIGAAGVYLAVLAAAYYALLQRPLWNP